MDARQARERLLAERDDVAALLRDTEEAVEQDQAVRAEPGDAGDAAQPLAAQGVDEATAERLRDRLETIDRALQRLDDGSYGRSVRSGVPIPDARLEADPAAELTVEEARDRR